MTKIRLVVSILLALPVMSMSAQTLDTDALAKFPPAVQRQAFEVCRYVKLTPEQQVKLARAMQKEDAYFLETVKHNEGVLPAAGQNRLKKMRENTIAELLDKEQQEQYWRGVYGAEAMEKGASVANALQKKYDLTDQNWKFINVAVYKMTLEEKVIKKMMADQPKKAVRMIQAVRDEQLTSIEKKGGIRVDPEKMTVEVIREFDPNALHK